MENRVEMIAYICEQIEKMDSEQFDRLLAEIATMEAEKRAEPCKITR